MTARLTADAILATIHNLADERFRLYRKPARCFHGIAGEHLRERIKALTLELDELWGLHRVMLASGHIRRPRLEQAYTTADTFYDFVDRALPGGGSVWQVENEEGSGAFIDLAAIVRLLKEEYRQDRHRATLHDHMARRGKTLVWKNPHSGIGEERDLDKVAT